MGQISFASILLRNFLKYDFIIFVVALLTLFFLVLTLRRSEALFKLMNHTVFVPEEKSAAIVDGEVRDVREFDVVLLRRRTLAAYSMFANLIMIFPLLGILGTVISLLPLVSQMGQAQMQSNFFAALTSTFWGLVFAILFKAIDGWVAGRMEDNEHSVQLYLSRNARPKDVA